MPQKDVFLTAKIRQAKRAAFAAQTVVAVMCSAGSALADLNRGIAALEHGDMAAAMREFRPAAEKGDPSAEAFMGMVYYIGGKGVPRDYRVAYGWYQKSADQDDPLAEYMLGLMYLNGRGVELDEKASADWFKKSASHGLSEAEALLGLAYVRGTGVRKDKVQAYKWLDVSLRDLPKGKLRDQVKNTHDQLSALMTDKQHERAEALVAKFSPKGSGGRRGSSGAGEDEAGPIATGSGFVVSAAGHVVTNDHVIAQCGHLRVRHLGDDAIVANVVARDSQNDLALLQLAKAWPNTAALRAGTDARAGDGVVAVGFPYAGLLADDANITTGAVSALAGLKNDARFLQISAPVQPGNSGGPLLDMSGNVIGVVSAKLDAQRIAAVTGDIPQNVNFAIKVALVRKFLDDNRVRYQTADAGRKLEAADVGERAKTFTPLVECWK
jgi:S1-C subfamily serine protease